MFSNAEVAEVLETAADLYESDKVDWCQNSWGGAEPDLNGGMNLTACASTSLGLAVGLGVHIPGLIDSVFDTDHLSDEELDDRLKERLMERVDPHFLAAQSMLYGGKTMRYSLRGVRLYKTVRELMDSKVGVHASSTLPNFNDSGARTKQIIIDLFKETAKELRNAQ